MQFRHIDVALLVMAGLIAIPAVHAAETKTLGTGAAVGQTAGQYVDDATLTTKVKVALLADSLLSAFEVKVDSDKGIVTLTGQVDKAETIQRAVKLASAVPGVKGINTQLMVKIDN
jgi:hyperosmotically inducible protein